VQIGQHRAVLLLQQRRQGRRRILQPALQRGDAPHRPDEHSERDDSDGKREFSHAAL